MHSVHAAAVYQFRVFARVCLKKSNNYASDNQYKKADRDSGPFSHSFPFAMYPRVCAHLQFVMPFARTHVDTRLRISRLRLAGLTLKMLSACLFMISFVPYMALYIRHAINAQRHKRSIEERKHFLSICTCIWHKLPLFCYAGEQLLSSIKRSRCSGLVSFCLLIGFFIYTMHTGQAS